MISSAIIVIRQQFSGVNIMAFYSSTIFSEANYSVRDSLLASMGYGLVMFLFALPAVYTMDTFGRRNLLLFTFPNMAWCLLGAGLSFLLPEGSKARVPLIAWFIYMFTAFYGPGESYIPDMTCRWKLIKKKASALFHRFTSVKRFRCHIESLVLRLLSV